MLGRWRVGQLGTGGREDHFVPTAVSWPDQPAGTTVTRVSAGAEHTCALVSDGSAWCWGINWTGQLGNGDVHSSRDRPYRVVDTAFGGQPVIALSAGQNHTCAVIQGGTAWRWGADYWGVLGDTDDSSHVSLGNVTAALTPGPVDVAPGMPPLVDIVAGINHTCAIGDDGTAWC